MKLDYKDQETLKKVESVTGVESGYVTPDSLQVRILPPSPLEKYMKDKLNRCIEALKSIGIIVGDEEDPRDSLEVLKERWLKREKEQLINTMLEDTQICRDALRSIGEIK
jgi:hypothetical protein